MKDKNRSANYAVGSLVMIREYARGSGAYVRTNLIVRTEKGQAVIEDLKPSVIGKLTKAGVEKL